MFLFDYSLIFSLVFSVAKHYKTTQYTLIVWQAIHIFSSSEPALHSQNKKKKLKLKLRKGLVDAIGNSPSIRINSLSEAAGCEILRKCEFLNLGGNVKDRVAIKIIEEAIESGRLTRGGMVTEGSVRSTAVSLTTVTPTYRFSNA